MKKRNLLFAAVIALMLSLMIALSSCAGINSLIDTILPGDNSGNVEGGSNVGGESDGTVSGGDSSNDSAGNLPGGSTDTEGGANADTEQKQETEFIPGNAENIEQADKLTSAQRALLSTVIVMSSFDSLDYFGRPTSQGINGSGVIWSLDRESGDALIVTNYHVVFYKESGISENIKIYLYGMEATQYAISAEFVGGSMTEDIAVLKVTGSEVLKNSCAVGVKVGDSATLSVTDRVLAVGNPEGDGISATDGIVSMNDETISMTASDGRTTISLRVIRIDCGINEGNSGGGLYDSEGRLVGIVNAKKTGSEIDNIGWALPIDRVKNLVDNILDHCDGEAAKHPKKALLGVTLYAAAMGVKVDSVSGDIRRYEVVEVHELTETCIIADKIQVGDRISYTVIDGVRREADRVHMVVDHLLTARVGSTLVIGVVRDGESFEITVTLVEKNFVEVS